MSCCIDGIDIWDSSRGQGHGARRSGWRHHSCRCPCNFTEKTALTDGSKDPTVSGLKKTPRSQSNIPLLLVSLDVLCLTVVASALFCLCCKYWAFCLQTYRKTHTWSTPPALKCKPHWIIAKDKNLPACPFQASPSKPLPTFYSVRQTLQIICKPIQFICFFLTVRFKVLHHKLYCISKFFSPSPGCSAFMLTLYSLQNTWYAVVFFFLGLMTEKQQQQLSTSLTFPYKEREM